MARIVDDRHFMSRALELALQGRGQVEPNPMVGCVVVRGNQIVGEGWHQRFGGPHAEIEALASAGDAARGADVFVSLEPCCFQGKTGPCTGALIDAGVARVAVGCRDPNPEVAGAGLIKLREAGIEVEENVLFDQAGQLVAPFAKLVTQGRPWVIAKWAMTLDGKLASRTGSSQWITGEGARTKAHQIRGQVDAILVGRGTVEADDPLLTARPPGPRTALRVVLDAAASLSTESRLVQSLDLAPLLVAVAANAPADRRVRLEALGVEVFVMSGSDEAQRVESLLDELGRRRLTNLLVEGGAKVFGTLLDVRAIDEVHAYVSPKLLGGEKALSAIAGDGIAKMADAIELLGMEVEVLDRDVHLSGRVRR